MTEQSKLQVAVIYHIWPHYRTAVALAMQNSNRIDYIFHGSGEALEGIPHADTSLFHRFVRAPFRYYGRFLWQSKAVQAALWGNYDAIIYLGDANFASTWVSAFIARLKKTPTLFWAHGWLRPETSVKRRMRHLFYRLAKRVLVYSERAKHLGTDAGFPASRIEVIYNSLDVLSADSIVSQIECGSLSSSLPQALFADPSRPLIICTARLTSLCRLDLLLEAAAQLQKRGHPLNVLLIGDGPERMKLQALSQQKEVAVYFYGACYDERTIGQMIYHADLTVSPGKIGLTAMHSLMYGTPAITHSNLDEQMPEVEAVVEGVTGSLFDQGDINSLAAAIEGWLTRCRERAEIRIACRRVIQAKWNPLTQAAIIEKVVLDVVHDQIS